MADPVAAPADPAPAADPAPGGAPPAAAPAANANAPAASAPPGTLAGGDTPPAAPAAPQTWPDDWRQRLAGDDKAYLKTLERFTDPGALAKSYRELQARNGQMKAPPPAATASPEELATWRKENGIPETAAAYVEKLELPNGMVIGEADRPIVAQFAEQALADNLDPKAFNGLVAKYYAMQDAQAKEIAANDNTFKIKSMDELNKEWGAEFRANINSITALLNNAPEGVKDRLLAGRTADGNTVGNDPAILRWLAGLAREINPMAALMPAGTSNAMKAGEDRIAEIEGLMRSPDAHAKYWSKPEVQEEYRQLLTARESMKQRGQ